MFFLSTLGWAGPADIEVFVSAPGVIDAWIDFNANGVCEDPGERILGDPVVPGSNIFTILAFNGAGLSTLACLESSINPRQLGSTGAKDGGAGIEAAYAVHGEDKKHRSRIAGNTEA